MPVKTYFITGATGAVGSAIVPLLLRDPESRIILLVRAQDRKNMEERLQDLCRFWRLEYADIRDRIRLHLGDIRLPSFGIDSEEYGVLATKCTHIIHSAGVVRMNLPLTEARKTSLDAAKNIVSLAEKCLRNRTLQKVEFVSTVGVAGRLAGLVPETWITEPRSFHNTYEQAKAEAEAFIAGKVGEGLPITVHRPSMVVGNSKTGRIIHFQIFYHLCEFLTGRRTDGVIPRIHNLTLDTVPVNYVAELIVSSSNQPSWAGKILHHCSGPDRAVEITALMEIARKIFIQSGQHVPRALIVPLPIFRKATPLLKPFVSSGTRRALNTLPFFFEYLAEKQSFSNTNTLNLIEAETFKLPLPEEYLETVLQYYLKKRYK